MNFQKQSLILFCGGLLFFILDRTLKYLAVNANLRGGFFVLVQNKGLAFGLPFYSALAWPADLLIGIILCAFVFLLVKYFKSEKRLPLSGAWLVILGAASNLLDRLKSGYVVDYIDLRLWPVFNLADAMIVLGLILILWDYWRSSKNDQ